MSQKPKAATPTAEEEAEALLAKDVRTSYYFRGMYCDWWSIYQLE